MHAIRSFIHTHKILCPRVHPILSHRLAPLSCISLPSARYFASSKKEKSIPDVGPLPQLPPRPSFPAPYVTDKEFTEYITPLFPWCWRIDFLRKELLLRDGELLEQSYNAPAIRRSFGFYEFATLSQFLRESADTFASEKHAPSGIFIRGSRIGGLVQVQLALSTEQARGAPSLTKLAEERIGPGLTMHDVRMAIKLEEHYTKRYVAKQLGCNPTFDVRFQTRWRNHRSATQLKRSQRIADEKVLRGMVLTAIVRPDTVDVTPEPIPEAPEPSDEPCTNGHFQNVIVPLYTRGWSIVYNNATFLENEKHIAVKLPVLYGFYRLNSFENAIAFTQDIIKLADEEKFPITMWIDCNTVSVQHMTSRSSKPEIKISYARFAVLLERLFVEKYADKARKSSSVFYSQLAHPKTVEEIAEDPLRLKMTKQSKMEEKKRNRKREEFFKSNATDEPNSAAADDPPVIMSNAGIS